MLIRQLPLEQISIFFYLISNILAVDGKLLSYAKKKRLLQMLIISLIISQKANELFSIMICRMRESIMAIIIMY